MNNTVFDEVNLWKLIAIVAISLWLVTTVGLAEVSYKYFTKETTCLVADESL